MKKIIIKDKPRHSLKEQAGDATAGHEFSLQCVRMAVEDINASLPFATTGSLRKCENQLTFLKRKSENLIKGSSSPRFRVSLDYPLGGARKAQITFILKMKP